MIDQTNEGLTDPGNMKMQQGNHPLVRMLCQVNLDRQVALVTGGGRGPFLCARAVLPGMIARGQGRIVNVASGKGASPVPYLGAYVTSKAALIRFTENLALECREHGIRVFAIHPGTVRTAMVTEVIDSPAGRQWLPWFRDAVEQGQYVTPECAAQLVLQLASGRADALSGRFLRIDQDLDTLIARAEEIAATDLYRLRVREAA